jgi:hypothetical protein
MKVMYYIEFLSLFHWYIFLRWTYSDVSVRSVLSFIVLNDAICNWITKYTFARVSILVLNSNLQQIDKQVGLLVKLKTCAWEVLGSNHNSHTRLFWPVFCNSPHSDQAGNLKYVITTNFQILFTILTYISVSLSII